MTELINFENDILNIIHKNCVFVQIENKYIKENKDKLITLQSQFPPGHILLVNQYHIYDENIFINNINYIIKSIINILCKIEKYDKITYVEKLELKDEFFKYYIQYFPNILLLYPQLEKLKLNKIKQYLKTYYNSIYYLNNLFNKYYIRYNN